MTRKILVVAILVSMLAGLAHATPRRTIYTKENKMPEKYQPEIGATFFYRESSEEYANKPDRADEYTATPYGRVGITENFAVFGEFPIEYINPNEGSGEAGLGDVAVGIELLAWEDIFRYPYILPYVTVSFPTGDEDKGMGAGVNLTTFGVSIGTTTYDVLDWVADAQYVVYSDEENIAKFSGSLIWNVSEIFTIQGEVRVTDEQQTEPDSDHPVYILGGVTYTPAEEWFVGLYGGGSSSANQDVLVGTKIAYTF